MKMRMCLIAGIIILILVIVVPAGKCIRFAAEMPATEGMFANSDVPVVATRH
jgi:hypothetical protein